MRPAPTASLLLERERLNGGVCNLVQQPHAEISGDTHDAVQVSASHTVQKVGVVAITGIGPHPLERHLGSPRLIQQGQRQLRLGLESDGGRNLSLVAPFGILTPCFGQVQLSERRPGKVGVYIVGCHRYLTIGRFAQSAAVLVGDADTFASLAREAAVIEDQHPITRNGLRKHNLEPLAIHRGRIPPALRQQAVNRRFGQTGHCLGDASTALALKFSQQPGGIPLEHA
jgi:hypothetical protein